MTQMPDGAQLSPDGHYWLDTTTNDWKPVPGGAADTAAASTASAAGAAAAAAGGGQKTGTATQEGAVRPSDAQPISELALVDANQVDVPEMEHEGHEHEGEGLA